MMMNIPTGDELLALLGLSESDERILNLFESLEIKRDEIEVDEDIGSFWVDFEDDYGFALSFSDVLPASFITNIDIGGNYLVYVYFDYSFHALPYGIEDTDNLEMIEEKLEKKANYIDKDDDTKLTWIYEDLGVLTIEFQDNKYKEVINIIINLYEEPKAWLDALSPFKK